MKFSDDQALDLMLAGRIDGEKVLDLVYARGINLSAWCRERQIDRHVLYKILRGELGKRRSARECRRILSLLNAEELLVAKSSESMSANA